MTVSNSPAAAGDGNRRAVLIGAIAVPVMGLLAVPAPQPGPLTWHMVLHIATMNVAAPLAALGLTRRAASRARIWATPSVLWIATLWQLAMLWVSHSPAVHHGALIAPLGTIALHGLLFLAALAFWLAVVEASTHRWQAMLALLVSGKLACLLGVLLVFAPRPLFASAMAHAAHAGEEALLADQQLAGLLMIAACPLSYVLTAVVLVVQVVNGLDQASTRPASTASLGR
jgi:putative membrane protein